MNSREALLAKTDFRYEKLELPSGEKFLFRNMTITERDQNELIGLDPKTGELDMDRLRERRLRMLCVQMVDINDKSQCFKEDEWELLQDLDGAVAGACFATCLKLNGLDEVEVKELVGNSD